MASNIRRWNICTRKEYGDGQNKKVFWPNVGTMVWFPPRQTQTGESRETYKMELNMFPGTAFYVFENKPKEQPAPQPAAAEYPTEEISADSIPY
jgi:hypothetical protein